MRALTKSHEKGKGMSTTENKAECRAYEIHGSVTLAEGKKLFVESPRRGKGRLVALSLPGAFDVVVNGKELIRAVENCLNVVAD